MIQPNTQASAMLLKHFQRIHEAIKIIIDLSRKTVKKGRHQSENQNVTAQNTILLII